jgi:hypothetical protein
MLDSDRYVPSMPLRREDLIEAPASNDLLLYDRTTNRAFRLNPEAAAIWRRCDGQTSVEEIVRMGGSLAEAALARLQTDGLITEGKTETIRRGVSRRAFVQVGMATAAGAVAFPLIESIAGGTVASAASTCAVGTCCQWDPPHKHCIRSYKLGPGGTCVC